METQKQSDKSGCSFPPITPGKRSGSPPPGTNSSLSPSVHVGQVTFCWCSLMDAFGWSKGGCQHLLTWFFHLVTLCPFKGAIVDFPMNFPIRLVYILKNYCLPQCHLYKMHFSFFSSPSHTKVGILGVYTRSFAHKGWTLRSDHFSCLNVRFDWCFIKAL